MHAPPAIPLLSTEALWRRYVHAPQPFEAAFPAHPERFLITRLEAVAPWMKLPAHPHRREVTEILFLTRGRLLRGADGRAISLGPGETHILLASQISSVDFISEDIAGYYCHFSLETIIQLYHKEHMVQELLLLGAHMKAGGLRLNPQTAAAVEAIFERLLAEYQSQPDLRLIDAYLVTLCYELRRCLPAVVPEQRQPRAEVLADDFKNLIIKHISEFHPLSFYAGQLGVSPNHLNKAVRQATGQSASELIAALRLLEAKMLLRHGSLSISEVAYRLGFLDPSYFSRFFRKHAGLTPGQYRLLD